MFQKACWATAGSCTEPDQEKDAIIVKSPEKSANYNELDYKDFDIVRAVQVCFQLIFIATPIRQITFLHHYSMEHLNVLKSSLKLVMILMHPTMTPFISFIGLQSIIVERLSSTFSKKELMWVVKGVICNRRLFIGVCDKVI